MSSDRKLRHSRSESKRKAAKSGFGSKHPSAGLEELTCVEEAKTRCPCGNNTETGTMIQVFLHFFFKLVSLFLICVFAELNSSDV